MSQSDAGKTDARRPEARPGSHSEGYALIRWPNDAANDSSVVNKAARGCVGISARATAQATEQGQGRRCAGNAGERSEVRTGRRKGDSGGGAGLG